LPGPVDEDTLVRVLRSAQVVLASCLVVGASAGTIGCHAPNPGYRVQPAELTDARPEAPGSTADGAGGATSQSSDANTAVDASPDPGVPADAGAPLDMLIDLAVPASDGPAPVRDASDTAPASGLLAAWAFDQPPAGGAKSIGDAFGNTATLRGSASWGSDRPAGATGAQSLAFAGGDSYVELSFPQGKQPTSTGDKTVAFWCKSTDPGTTTRTLIALYDRGKTDFVGLQIGIGEHKIEAWPYGLTFKNLTFTTATPRDWHHVAYTFSAGKHSLLVDGAVVDTSTTWVPQPGVLDIARLGTTDETATPANFYLGFMRDVRIYSRALSPAEVQSLSSPR
jgi:hypothetical protein